MNIELFVDAAIISQGEATRVTLQ